MSVPSQNKTQLCGSIMGHLCAVNRWQRHHKGLAQQHCALAKKAKCAAAVCFTVQTQHFKVLARGQSNKQQPTIVAKHIDRYWESNDINKIVKHLCISDTAVLAAVFQSLAAKIVRFASSYKQNPGFFTAQFHALGVAPLCPP